MWGEVIGPYIEVAVPGATKPGTFPKVFVDYRINQSQAIRNKFKKSKRSDGVPRINIVPTHGLRVDLIEADEEVFDLIDADNQYVVQWCE